MLFAVDRSRRRRSPGSMSPATPRSPSAASDIWGFLAFSHGWTWLFWCVAVLRGVDVWSSPLSLSLLVTGALGVPVGGIVMTRRLLGTSGLRDLARRILDVRRITGWWWAAILFLYPGLKLLASTLAALIGTSARPVDLHSVAERISHPGAFLLSGIFILLLGPLPEEVGWRGYLLDWLQERWSALASGLILGVIWAGWHIPLFLMPGYYARSGGPPPDPVVWAAGVLMVSVVITWVYNNTGRSVLAAILLHFTDNWSGELLDPSWTTEVYTLPLVSLVVLLVLGWWSPASPGRHGLQT